MPTMSDDTMKTKKSHTAIWVITAVVVVLVAGGTFVGIRVMETKALEDVKIFEPEAFCENYKVGSVTSDISSLSKSTPAANQESHANLLMAIRLSSEADTQLGAELATLRKQIDASLESGDWSAPLETAQRIDDTKGESCP